MLNFVRRLLRQFADGQERMLMTGRLVEHRVVEQFQFIKKLYKQQWQMHREKSHRVDELIVSLPRPYVQPVLRVKSGREIEFGPKAALPHAGGL